MACEIKLKFGNIDKTFYSNEELDGWLYDHPGLIGLDSIKGDIQFSLGNATEAQKETIGRINNAVVYRNRLQNSKQNTTFLQNLGASAVTIGPTTAFQYMGNPSGSGFTSPVVTYTNSNSNLKDFYTNIGKDFEAAFEYCLKGTPYKGLIIKDPTKRDALIKVANSILEQIKRKHDSPNGACIIQLQTKIAASELSSSFLDSVHTAMGQKQDASGNTIPAVNLHHNVMTDVAGNIRQATGSDVNAFVGDIDLLVIDANGKAYVYDFKTSSRDLSIENSPNYALQIASYRQILKQYDIDVADDCYLIPIKIDYEQNIDPNLGDDNIKGFSFNKNNWRLGVNEGSEYARRVSKWFPSKANVNYEGYSKIHEIMEKSFPSASVETQSRIKETTVEEEFKAKVPIPENDIYYKAGYRWRYWKRGFINKGEEKAIIAKTEDQLKEGIAKWVEEVNKRSAEINTLFSKNIKSAIKSKSLSELEEAASNFNQSDTSYIKAAFRRYVSGNWNLISNDLMIANGLFLFQKQDIVELVVISTHNLFNRLQFNHGKTTRPYNSILGHFASDEDGLDSRWILPNFFGNIEMMKGMIFLSQHPELFTNAKINKVSTVSLLSPGYMEESNEKLVENFKMLNKYYKQSYKEDLGILSIGSEFTSDVDSYIRQATDLMEHSAELAPMLRKPAFADVSNPDIKQIMRMINTLRNRRGDKLYRISSANWNDADWVALQYLDRALLSKISYQISPELRTGAYTSGGLALDGLYARSFADSKSAIARTLHEATYSWTRICQNEFVQYTNKWKKAIQDLYIEGGHSMFWGGEWNFFEKFFIKANDKLDSRFILKPRGSMQTSTENRVLDLFYDALDRFKYGNNPQAIADAQVNGTYGTVPLIKSHLNEKLGKMNPIKAIADKFATDWNVFKDFLLGIDISEARVKELNDIDAGKLPTFIFDDEFRDQKLQFKNGEDPTAKYTTDIDLIFNMMVAEGIKRERSPQMLMTSSAIRACTSYMLSMGLDKTGNWEEFSKGIDDYIKRKIFNMPIINESNTNLQRIINIIKGITSVTTLGVSLKAFTRETVTGIERAFARVSLNPELKAKISLPAYREALWEVMSNCYKNTDVMSWHMQLNAIYGTANFSYNQMAENSTIQQWGLKNLDASDLFFTATWPDFIHRNAIVIAYMKTTGAYDAYSMEDGVLKYDMQKDKRFKTLLKYKNREDCPESDIKNWEREHNLYMDNLNSWINNGYRKPDGTTLQEGDDLPQALSPREVLGLKDIADRMYGNYDDETKSLMRDQLLGSLFLQFRTYGINRLQEFFDGDTFTSDIHMEEVTIIDENGVKKRVYMVENPNKEAVQKGEEFAFALKTEDQISPSDIKEGKAILFRRPVSHHIIGGQVQTLVDIGATLFLFKNQKEFEEMWKNNPTYRANVRLFFLDTLGMAILALIINAFYGNLMQGDYDDIDWFTQWSYNVAIGVTQDGPVWSVLSSVVGDGTPPMLGILQNYGNNIMSVITGKKNFLYAVANTFGATRELAYLFNAR